MGAHAGPEGSNVRSVASPQQLHMSFHEGLMTHCIDMCHARVVQFWQSLSFRYVDFIMFRIT